MKKIPEIVLIIVLAISVVLLGMRPLLFSIAKIPFDISWNANNAEEEEEHKTGHKDHEKVRKNSALNFIDGYLFSAAKHFSHLYIFNIKEVHLPYPTPPPKA